MLEMPAKFAQTFKSPNPQKKGFRFVWLQVARLRAFLPSGEIRTFASVPEWGFQPLLSFRYSHSFFLT